MEGFGCIPGETQGLLLRASLLSGDEAIRAWESWIARVDIDTLDGGSIRLLPLLYSRLKKEGIDDPRMGRFKGIYRHHWYKNQLLMAGVAPIVRSLEAAGIPTLLLKGAGLIHGYYPDYGLRPMGDFDLLVPVSAALQTLRQLQRDGWTSAHGRTEFTEEIISSRREHSFLSPTGLRVDLHWHVMEPYFAEGRADSLDAAFWQGAQPIRWNGVATAIPDPADLLLHVCVHGSEGQSFIPPLRWAADAFTVLSKPGVTIDWDRLLSLARQNHLSLPLRDTLGYLAAELRAPVPDVVLRDLERIPTTRRQRAKYVEWSAPPHLRAAMAPPPGAWEALRSHRRSYAEWAVAAGEKDRTLLRYLQSAWHLDSVTQVPGTILRRGLKKVIAVLTAGQRRQAVLNARKEPGR